jgi:SNF2 family DNA or RNA helicase
MSTSKKLVIFLHHKDVAAILTKKLTDLCASWSAEYGSAPLTLESHHSMQERQDIIDRFQSGKSRILIASTLAAGEGVDGIQNVCSDIVILERQWNPANEEQVEGRIERMGQLASNLTSTYMVATGTIDEFFAEIVERKRVYVANTLDGVVGLKWDESSIMKELAESLSLNGRKRWSW